MVSLKRRKKISPTEKIMKLGKILNVHTSNNDIDICHRIATRRTNGYPRPIIVRFKSYRAKNELYRARKLLKSVSLNNYFHNTKAVYINENLTSYRRDLFAKVRKFRKDNQWHSAWTIDGKIFVRKSQSDQVKRIYGVEDLKISVKSVFVFFLLLLLLLPQKLIYAMYSYFTPRLSYASLISQFWRRVCRRVFSLFP